MLDSTTVALLAKVAGEVAPEHSGPDDPPSGSLILVRERYSSNEHHGRVVFARGVWASEAERELFARSKHYRRGLDVEAVEKFGPRQVLVRYKDPWSRRWWGKPWLVTLSWPGKGQRRSAVVKVQYVEGGEIKRVRGGYRWCCTACWDAGRYELAAGVLGSPSTAETRLREHAQSCHR